MEPVKCPDDCRRDYLIRGSQRYEFTITTSSLPNSGDSALIYVELSGTEGKTGKMVLSEDGFTLGSVKKINLYSNDIGEITSMRLSSEYVEQWRPDKIVISKAGMSNDEFLPKGEKLSCPSKCSM